MKNFKKVGLIGSVISGFILLPSCSQINTGRQNLMGMDLEAYYSDKTQVVCFTTSSNNQENINCLPASSVKTDGLKPNEWEVV